MRTSRPALVAIWAATTGLLGAGVLTVHLGASPLDDPNPAHQRPGYLDANGSRDPAPTVVGLGPAGTRTVIFFTRAERLDRLQRALAGPDGQTLRRTARVVVVQDTEGGTTAGVVPDPSDRISRAYDLRRPRDRGAPVGYAVVGPDGTVRYRTDDPGVEQHLSEALTMAKAT